MSDVRGNNPNPLINGNCCELGTGPMVAVGCELLLLPIAVAAACERFCAWAAMACAAAARNSIKQVAGVNSLKSHGCSSEGGEIWPSFDFRSERKTKIGWSYLYEKLESCDNAMQWKLDSLKRICVKDIKIRLKHEKTIDKKLFYVVLGNFVS